MTNIWIVEFGLFAVGIALYARATRAADGVGRWGLVGLVTVLVVAHLGNLFGPPPPSVTAIAVAGNALWLIVLLGWWVDRHRTPA